MAIPYQGPYSPAVYKAANQIQSGTVNQSYAAPIWQTAQQLAKTSQPQKGAISSPSPVSSPYSAPAPAQNNGLSDLEAQMRSAAEAQSRAELEAANTEFDRNAETLRGQQDFLGVQRGNTLSSLASEFGNVQNQAKRQKDYATTNNEQQTQDALATAQDVQRKSRNTLRALGILNSTAAGEMLQKPFMQYDQQRARLTTAFNQRINELDDYLNAQAEKHAQAVKEVEANYTNLIGNIQRDLRFNERSRIDAVRSANASLQKTLAEIQSSIMNYKTQVDAAKLNAQNTLSSMNNYTAPTADLNSIKNSQATGDAAKYSGNASLYLTEDQLNKKQGIPGLSGY